jgi:hypothetical protein
VSNTDTDALVPLAWVWPSKAPNWHAPVWNLGPEPPTPLTRPEAIARGWSPLYGSDTIERLTRDDRHLRRLLAVCVAMPGTYYYDSEAQGQEHGISIDFMREPVAHIDAKLRALNVARIECSAVQTLPRTV